MLGGKRLPVRTEERQAVRDRQVVRQTGRKTDRQEDCQRGRQTVRETERQSDRLSGADLAAMMACWSCPEQMSLVMYGFLSHDTPT